LRTFGSERDKGNWGFAVLHIKSKYDYAGLLVFLGHLNRRGKYELERKLRYGG
jgi:hypothetical protein